MTHTIPAPWKRFLTALALCPWNRIQFSGLWGVPLPSSEMGEAWRDRKELDSRASKQRMNKWVTCGFLPLTWRMDSVDSCTRNEVPADEGQYIQVHIGDREEQNSSPIFGVPPRGTPGLVQEPGPAMVSLPWWMGVLLGIQANSQQDAVSEKKKKMVVAGVSKQEWPIDHLLIWTPHQRKDTGSSTE